MNKLIFDETKFLKKSDLTIGHIYIFKDGGLALYLGKNNCEKLVFYMLGVVLFAEVEYPTRTLAHYEAQVSYLNTLVDTLMNHKCDRESLAQLNNMPRLYCEYPFMSYSMNHINLWWSKNLMILNNGLPDLVELTKSGKKNSLFVSAKDLVPGELYYTGGLWRSLYLYLGRDSRNNFCWFFVGNTHELLKNDFNIFRIYMDRTKSNKRCKRLVDAPNDPDAMMYADAMKLLKMNYKADLRGLKLD